MRVIWRRTWLGENDRDLVGLPKKEADSQGAVYDYLIGDYFLEIHQRLREIWIKDSFKFLMS